MSVDWLVYSPLVAPRVSEIILIIKIRLILTQSLSSPIKFSNVRDLSVCLYGLFFLIAFISICNFLKCIRKKIKSVNSLDLKLAMVTLEKPTNHVPPHFSLSRGNLSWMITD